MIVDVWVRLNEEACSVAYMQGAEAIEAAKIAIDNGALGDYLTAPLKGTKDGLCEAGVAEVLGVRVQVIHLIEKDLWLTGVRIPDSQISMAWRRDIHDMRLAIEGKDPRRAHRHVPKRRAPPCLQRKGGALL